MLIVDREQAVPLSNVLNDFVRLTTFDPIRVSNVRTGLPGPITVSAGDGVFTERFRIQLDGTLERA